MFKNIPDTTVKAISFKEIKKNDFIIYAGTPCDTVYMILSGNIEGLDHQRLGRVYNFMDFTKMYIVGDFEVFADIPEYCVSIRATEDCKLLAISAKHYLQWVQHDENALFLRMKRIMSTLTFEKKNEREYMFMNCKERLVDYLIKSYKNRKSNSSDIYKLVNTQAELSEKIGFNVRSVQRNIAALEKEKLITIESGKITISSEQFLLLEQFMEG